MQEESEIHVPALMGADQVIVPAVALGREIEYRTDGQNRLTAAAYQVFNPPPLAELRRAYFDTNERGPIAPEYREAELPYSKYTGCAELTSTLLEGEREIIENPESVTCNGTYLVRVAGNILEFRGIWSIEGGKRTRVELPPEGWVIEYDRSTGFPSRTSNKEAARREFGDDASYFTYVSRRGESDLRCVAREQSDGLGPFYINALHSPFTTCLGARSCRGLE